MLKMLISLMTGFQYYISHLQGLDYMIVMLLFAAIIVGLALSLILKLIKWSLFLIIIFLIVYVYMGNKGQELLKQLPATYSQIRQQVENVRNNIDSLDLDVSGIQTTLHK